MLDLDNDILVEFIRTSGQYEIVRFRFLNREPLVMQFDHGFAVVNESLSLLFRG